MKFKDFLHILNIFRYPGAFIGAAALYCAGLFVLTLIITVILIYGFDIKPPSVYIIFLPILFSLILSYITAVFDMYFDYKRNTQARILHNLNTQTNEYPTQIIFSEDDKL